MRNLIAPLLSLALAAGVMTQHASRSREPADAAAYHARVRDAAQYVPYRIGDWVGVDTEIRQAALRILNSNLALSRTYRNMTTGQTATLLIVHCADSRSLLGHYPPVCYPAHGWTQVDAAPRQVTADGLTARATEYAFAYETLDRSARMMVVHFTVVPDGRIAPDMGPLESSARDGRQKYFGGASLQFVIDASMTEQQRAQTYEVLLRAASRWIKSTQPGVNP